MKFPLVVLTVVLPIHSMMFSTRESEPIMNEIGSLNNPIESEPLIPRELISLTQAQLNTQNPEAPGPPLTQEDFDYATHLHDDPLNIQQTGDPILKAGLLEGDIQVKDDQAYREIINHLYSPFRKTSVRNAIRDERIKWPGKHIPYQISSEYNTLQRGAIANAVGEIELKTCLRIRPWKGEKDYIFIAKKGGCSSSVGRTGGQQIISLDEGCLHQGVIIHEFMHAIGFFHEHSRADRDYSVKINFNNIRGNYKYNFRKYQWDTTQSLGSKYDYGSLMHYGPRAFAKPGTDTITPHRNVEIGQRLKMSETDIAKINALYCKKPKPTPPPSVVTEAPSASLCIDSSTDCDYWARKGECRTNPQWMLKNCRISCKQCKPRVTTTEAGCVDNNQHCEYWAAIKQCTVNPPYMLKSCKKSCKVC